MSSIKIVILEDDTEVRNGLIEILTNLPNFIVLEAYSNAEDFINQMPDLIPDIVIIDIGLPGMSGIECVKKLKPLYPKMLFLMWTVFDDDEKIFDALCAGASGYILKNNTPENILQAIQDIAQGGSPMSANIARKVVASFHQKTVSKQELTKREMEMLELLSKGYRYKEIADKLFISIDTVRTHIRNIYEKLHVNSKLEAVNKVFRH